MSFYRQGTDEECQFKIGEEVTYSEDNMDYTIVGRLKMLIEDCKCFYQLRACDPNNPNQTLQIETTNEDKFTLTNCIEVMTKLWPNLTYENNGQFITLLTSLLGRICDGNGVTHPLVFKEENGEFIFCLDGVEFKKTI